MSQHMTKPTKCHVRLAKTQISLGICQVWSESSLCAQWVVKDPTFLHAADAQADLSLRWAHMPFCSFFSCTGSNDISFHIGQIKRKYVGCNVRKRTFCHVCPTKTQISLRIRAVWSESPLATWKKKLRVHGYPKCASEDSDQTARMRSLIWIFAGRICPKVRFLTLRLMSLGTSKSKKWILQIRIISSGNWQSVDIC